MTERLKRVLLSIDFKNRFDNLFEKHSHRNLLNMSTDLGIVEFILDAMIDGEGSGGPFGYMLRYLSRKRKDEQPLSL